MTDKNSKKEIMIQQLAARQREAETVRKIVLYASIAMASVFLIAVIAAFLYVNSALKPYDADNEDIIKVEIPIGSSTATIANILEENNIIKNAFVFKYYVKFQNESGFQAGNYELTQAMTLDEIIESLKSGKMVQEALFKITIPEGQQLREIAEKIAQYIDLTEDEVFNTLNSAEFVKKMQAEFPELLTDEILAKDIKYPLEGYLFPATYDYFVENPSLETIVKDMLSQTASVLKDYEATMLEKDMTVHELLTMASLIEEEAAGDVDRGKIASVFYNRLEVGMKLQTDPTVLYAMGKHKEALTFKDYEYEDPYSTYYVSGLTPGPIANAGISSIEAALNPLDTEYYYFLAADGKVYFSKTFEEHVELADKHIRNN